LKTTRLGKTGLKVFRVEMGSNSNVRLSLDEAGKLIQRTLDLEVNFADTSVGYEDNEVHIGKAIVGRREHAIISTKTWAPNKVTVPRR